MSEYWVSKKKYFCRYCETYIADDVPSRQQHENGLRHKGNTERFIRNLYKTGEKRKKELDDEKREMARVEQAAQTAFAQDIGAGLAKAAEPSRPPATSAARKPAVKPTNAYANYSSPASLGYQDPDAERLAAAAELRRTQGVVGQWELVADTPQDVEEESSGKPLHVPEIGTSLKREVATVIEDEDGRRFKLRKKTLGGGLGEVYDPGIIPIKSKKEESPNVATAVASPDVKPGEQLKPSNTPKWSKVQWKETNIGDGVKREPDSSDQKSSVADEPGDTMIMPSEGKIEEQPVSSSQDLNEGAPSLAEASPANSTLESVGNMFKKRKVPIGTTRGRRQM